jgi:hypothetical protein
VAGYAPVSFFEEFDVQRSENVLRVWSYGTMPPTLGLIISDCVHNLRAALDNLVYDLAIAYLGSPPPEPVAKHLEFPIFGPKPMSSDARKKRIGSIAPDAQTCIEGLQPHRRGSDYASDPLWTLHQLSNIDKHRVVYTTLLSENQGVFGSGNTNTHVYDITFGRQGGITSIEDTAELVSYRAAPYDPSRKMEVQFAFSFDIAFGQGSPKHGERVSATLTNLPSYIIDHIVMTLAPYLTRIPVVRLSQDLSLLSDVLPSRG